jgi:hypothetical protein
MAQIVYDLTYNCCSQQGHTISVYMLSTSLKGHCWLVSACSAHPYMTASVSKQYHIFTAFAKAKYPS